MLTLLNLIDHLIKVVHHFLFPFVAPVNIMYALVALMKVPDMSGPVQTQHFVPTTAHEANFVEFLNPLALLTSLVNNWIERRHLMAIYAMVAWITWSTLHLLTIFNIIS